MLTTTKKAVLTAARHSTTAEKENRGGHFFQPAFQSAASPAMQMKPEPFFSPDNRGSFFISRSADAGVPAIQAKGISSGSLTLTPKGQNVAKAPNNMSAARFADSGRSISNINYANFPVNAGSIVDGGDSGARVDLQGEFNAGGKTWSNIQVQANKTAGGADYTDLGYPGGTPAAQKGTSFAEVHVDNRILGSDQPDVVNRGIRLLKRGLYESRGDRGTYPRPTKKVTY